MINGKSGALALLGVLCLTAAAVATDGGPPIVFGADKTAAVDRTADGVLWDAFSFAAKGGPVAGDRASDAQHLHGCSWINGYEDNAPPCESPFTATADILILHRSTSGSQQLLFDPLNERSLLNASDMEFPLVAGPRVSVIGHGLCGLDIEASFFGIQGWMASANFPSSSLPAGFALLSVDSVFQGTQGLPVTDVRFTERSNLYNGELNVRRPIGDWLTLLAGFRWVELDDSYESQGVRSDETSFTHTIRAINHMYGFQVGADVSLFRRSNGSYQFGQSMVICDQSSPFQIDGFVKAGLFYNAASQNSDFSNPDSSGEFAAHAEGSHAAFLGDAGVIATYQFNKHFALRGGYQIMFVDSVALAARQISSTDLLAAQSATIETAGSVLYHGANAGLEFTW
jgi:hypothetical protein